MASVTFKPCARTVWHTNPLGETLIVTFGRRWVQREGGPIEEITPGDFVGFEPNEKHWHRATATKAMPPGTNQRFRLGVSSAIGAQAARFEFSTLQQNGVTLARLSNIGLRNLCFRPRGHRITPYSICGDAT